MGTMTQPHKPAHARTRRAHAFVAQCLAAMNAEPLSAEETLCLGTWLARFLWENCCGIYRLDELETAVLRKLPALRTPSVTRRGAELHVASAIFRTGGHTSLMRTLVHAAPVQAEVLLIRPTDSHEAASILGLPHERIHLLASSSDLSATLANLLAHLGAYDRIVLHIHPDDLLTAIAARLARQCRPQLNIAFMNHADHAFSVGIGAATKVFEISGYGWQLREARGIANCATFVGIPIALPDTWPPSNHSERYAFTGGTAFKYKPFNGKALPPILARLLASEPDLQLRVVGPRSKDTWWWALRWRHGKRVRMLKSLPKPSYLQMLQHCAFYIDSYPWPGGTAFPEALMRGGLVVGLRGGAYGYSLADALRCESADDFLETCRRLLSRDAAALARQAEVRRQCGEFHAATATRLRMDEAFASNELIAPPASIQLKQAIPAFEEDWQSQGRTRPPKLKGLTLPPTVRDTIWALWHRQFGWLNRDTLKLGFDLFLKRKKA